MSALLPGSRATERQLGRGRLRDLAAGLLIILLVLLFFWRIWTPDRNDRQSFPPGDFVSASYAPDRVRSGQLLQAQLPLWNPYANSGHPLLADPQAAAFYPPSLVTVLLSRHGGFSIFALELEAVAHFCLAGLFTYAFARKLIGRRSAALLSALCFTFGGYLTGYPIQQMAILSTNVWLPLIMLGLEVGVSNLESGKPHAWTALAAAGLALGISVLAGHPQSAMYVLYASVAYYLFRVWRLKDRRRAVAGAVVFLLVGVGLSAAQWLPSLEYMRLSTRSGLSYDSASSGFRLSDVVQIVLPSQSPLYFGILPLLLALASPLLMPRRQVWFWVGLGLAALGLSFGTNLFVYPVYYLLAPGFSLFQSQERAIVLAAFALAILAGYSIDSLARRRRPGWLCRGAAWLPVAGVGLAALGLFGWVSTGHETPSHFYWLLEQGVYMTLVLTGTAVLLRFRAPRELPSMALVAALVLVGLDLFTVNAAKNRDPRTPEAHIAPSALIRQLQADGDTFRVFDEFQLPAAFGTLFDLRETRGASPLRLERYRRLIEEVPLELASRLLNVKYVASWRDSIGVPSDVVATDTQDGQTTFLHRLSEPGPRAWVVHQVEIIPDDDDVVKRLSDWTFTPLQTAILPEPPDAAMEETDGDPGAASIHWLLDEPSRLELDVELPADGLLVLSEVYYPGWVSRVDDQVVSTLRANLTLRAVPVPSGKHRVVMVLRPWSAYLGIGLSTLTLVCVAVCVLAAQLRCRRSNRLR